MPRSCAALTPQAFLPAQIGNAVDENGTSGGIPERAEGMSSEDKKDRSRLPLPSVERTRPTTYDANDSEAKNPALP
jgi:hypothetical protein